MPHASQVHDKESFIDFVETEMEAYLYANIKPATLPCDFYGPAIVYRQASAFPAHFRGRTADHIGLVADIPVGNLVFCLPITNADVEWRPVIIQVAKNGGVVARFTWVHPRCVASLPGSSSSLTVKVHHTHERGQKLPTTDIGPVKTGTRIFQDGLVLDARWRSDELYKGIVCTGHCLGVCLGILTDTCFAQILEFARMLNRHKTGDVCCFRGKHRSVATANMLFLLFRVSVDMTYAARERCHRCCNMRVQDNIPALLDWLRAFPRLALTGQMLLANALRL